MEIKESFIGRAIELAKESFNDGDYTTGAVIELNGKVIGEGKTRLKHENDSTVHGEIVAIRNACKKMESGYLEGAILYTTHEPCPMCTSAAIWAKIKGMVYGASMEDSGSHALNNFSWRQINIKCKDILKHGEPQLEIEEEYIRKECNELFNLAK